MPSNPRWLWTVIAVLFVALVGLGAYTGLLQARLSSRITDVDDKLSANLATTEGELSADLTTSEEKLSAELTRTRESLTSDLQSLSNLLSNKADELATQLNTLDTLLKKEITDTSAELLSSVQSVRTRLDEVHTELTEADTTLGDQLTSQGTELIGNLGALSSDLATASSDLESLTADTNRLMVETSRSLLDLAPLYEAVKDSVVEIVTEQGAGSGFIYGAEATHVVTAWHVVDGASDILVRLSDGTEINATITANNKAEDLTILKLSQPASVQPLPLADSSELVVGQPILVVGSPQGLTGTATTGIISALGRAKEDVPEFFFSPWNNPTNLVQFDAAVNPGNSGGPAFNAAGEVIGIISFGLSILDDSGVNFAVASNLVKELADSVLGE